MDTWTSHVVTLRSTNQALSCLTSVIRRELVFSAWYGPLYHFIIIYYIYIYIYIILNKIINIKNKDHDDDDDDDETNKLKIKNEIECRRSKMK